MPHLDESVETFEPRGAGCCFATARAPLCACGAGNVQLLDALAFEGDAQQTSRSANCRLRLYAAGSATLIYDSGQQARTDSIIVYPRFPASSSRSGEVAVIGLNYTRNSASAVRWDNLLG